MRPPSHERVGRQAFDRRGRCSCGSLRHGRGEDAVATQRVGVGIVCAAAADVVREISRIQVLGSRGPADGLTRDLVPSCRCQNRPRSGRRSSRRLSRCQRHCGRRSRRRRCLSPPDWAWASALRPSRLRRSRPPRPAGSAARGGGNLGPLADTISIRRCSNLRDLGAFIGAGGLLRGCDFGDLLLRTPAMGRSAPGRLAWRRTIDAPRTGYNHVIRGR
jgi:hypothetical protein